MVYFVPPFLSGCNFFGILDTTTTTNTITTTTTLDTVHTHMPTGNLF